LLRVDVLHMPIDDPACSSALCSRLQQR
jgi:hypothetical protein